MPQPFSAFRDVHCPISMSGDGFRLPSPLSNAPTKMPFTFLSITELIQENKRSRTASIKLWTVSRASCDRTRLGRRRRRHKSNDLQHVRDTLRPRYCAGLLSVSLSKPVYVYIISYPRLLIFPAQCVNGNRRSPTPLPSSIR